MKVFKKHPLKPFPFSADAMNCVPTKTFWSGRHCWLPSLNSGRGRGWGRNLTFLNTLMPRPYTSVIAVSPRLFSETGRG